MLKVPYEPCIANPHDTAHMLYRVRNEDKHTLNLVSFDPANFEVSKVYQRNVQFSYRLARLFVDTFSIILRKKSEVVRNFFLHLWKCNLFNFIHAKYVDIILLSLSSCICQ